MINIKAIEILATEKELDELRAIGIDISPKKAISGPSRGIVKLKRTFNMTMDGMTLRFWRVIGPTGHKNYNSDLSVAGLRDWGIIK